MFGIKGDKAFLKMGDKADKTDRKHDGMFYLHVTPVNIPIEKPVEVNTIAEDTTVELSRIISNSEF